jgi:hypothetical protein
MVTTYLYDLSNIGCYMATIGLQDDLATGMRRFPYISEPPGSHWVNAGGFDVL